MSKKLNTWSKVKSQAPPMYLAQNEDEAAVDPMDDLLLPQVDEMAAQGVPDDMVVPPPQAPAPQPKPKLVIPKVIPQMSQGQSVTVQEKGPVIDPEMAKTVAGLRDQYESLRKSRMGEEQRGITDYEDEVNKYKNKSPGIDWRGVASVIDRFGDGSLVKLAEQTKPETEEEKRAKLAGMREKLEAMKSGLSKTQYEAIKDQLASYTAEMKAKTAENMLRVSMGQKDRSQDRLARRDDDKDLMEYEKRIQPFQKVDNTVAALEKILGFNLGEYDPKTQTVRGEKVDAPGVSVPMLGRINQATPQGRQVQAAMQRVINTLLKERSGAAVTDSEQQRMLQEFAMGKGKFNTEADLLNTLKQYGDLLSQDKTDVMGGFRPQIAERYHEGRSGLAKSYERKGGNEVKPARTKSLEKMSKEELDAYEHSLGDN